MDPAPRNNFDGIRLLAALVVIFSHGFPLLGQIEPLYLGWPAGKYAVCVFFAISGFLVAGSWRADPSVLRFAAKRALRIAPAYFLVVGVVSAAFWIAGRDGFDMNPTGVRNGPLWTIPLEVQCYVIFGILAAASRLGAIAMLCLCLILGHSNPFEEFATFFALGTLLNYYPRLRSNVATVALVFAGFILLPFDQVYGLTLIITPAVIAVGLASWPALRDAGRFGDLSYGTYLTAWPIQQCVIAAVGTQVPYLLAVGMCLALTLPVAWLLWRFVERPALGLKRHLKRRPDIKRAPWLPQQQANPHPKSGSRLRTPY